MSKELKVSTAAMLSKLWDDGTCERKRAGAEEPIEIRCKRLSAHLMIQPNLAPQFLGDAALQPAGDTR